MTGKDPAVVTLDGVVRRFGHGDRTVLALDAVSARILPGQVTGLVGPDGAGKTTLMRLIAGVLAPDAGGIRVLGQDIADHAAEDQTGLGYMPQRFGLYEDLSVAENLTLYADLHGVTGEQRRQRFAELMRFTGLEPFRGRLAGRLSGGMKQKLGLACTLISRPRLLLLDEPSVGVDPVSRRELWRMVYELVDQGVAVLWSTAYLDEAERCTQVLLLSEGRLLASGPPERFSDAVAGRTVEARLPAADRRALLNRAQADPRVLDGIIRGHNLRLLLTEGTNADELDLPKEIGPVTAVAPSFEDAFIALMRGDGRRDAETAPERPSTAPTPAETLRRAGDVIDVTGLTRVFGDFRAVDDVSFRVASGEIFGLLGPNGAGKSTMFKMLCGLLPPSAGSARVLGIDLRRAAARARERIGYMAQKFSLYGDMSVLQNLQFFASVYGLDRRRGRERIDWALGEFRLDDYRESNSRDLPLGFKQRLALACAILHEPGVLFLDEPTSGVDPVVRRGFWSRINAMANAGVTVMVTTHFLDEAEYCDRLAIVYRGRLIAAGEPETLKREHAPAETANPTLDDAFVALIEEYDREQSQ